jgi:hypothetical protein
MLSRATGTRVLAKHGLKLFSGPGPRLKMKPARRMRDREWCDAMEAKYRKDQ